MRNLIRILVVCGAILGFSRDSSAAAIYQVDFALPGAGQWFLDFQLIDGDGVQNNTVTLSNFNFGLGSGPTGSPMTVGGASGSTATSVVLTDSSFFTAFTQPITAGGSVLSFLLTLSANANSGGAPDRFAFGLLDAGGIPVPTTGLADEFLGIDITAPLGVTIFGTDPTRTALNLAPPQVRQVVAVPEPPGLTVLLLGIGLAGARRAWSKRQGRV